jgi:hypothetical protein
MLHGGGDAGSDCIPSVASSNNDDTALLLLDSTIPLDEGDDGELRCTPTDELVATIGKASSKTSPLLLPAGKVDKEFSLTRPSKM